MEDQIPTEHQGFSIQESVNRSRHIINKLNIDKGKPLDKKEYFANLEN
jgi:hypothetical protein